MTCAVGATTAVPVLTLAQLLGNLSRAGFGYREIRWRATLAFSAGAVPASVVGARLFVDLPADLILRLIGVFPLVIVALRHTAVGKRSVPPRWLPATGAVVGFLSAVVGSAGPLGAAVFLSPRLPKTAYVASEAVSATLMHATKSAVYGRYATLDGRDALVGLALGGAMVLGSWTGRKLIERLPDRWLAGLIEALLIAAAATLIV